MTTHNLGYPRIGQKRELKFAIEAYWKGEKSVLELAEIAAEIRRWNWQTQLDAGIDLLPVNDFAYYDQMLNMSTLLGVIPSRFRQESYELDVAFRMARGRAPSDDRECGCGGHHVSKAGSACDMKKWFDTNYHYIVPELEADTVFKLTDTRLFDELHEAKDLVGDASVLKPVLIGPLTYLYLAKEVTGSDKLDRLPALLEVYSQVLNLIAEAGVKWVQIDEPILVLELDRKWQEAFTQVYGETDERLDVSGLKVLLATYFDTLGDNLDRVVSLDVDGLHIDAVRGASQVEAVIEKFSENRVLSLGLVEGRNVWKNDFESSLSKAGDAYVKFKKNLWLAPSCSLLHSPVDLDLETNLDAELKHYLSFAKQKLDEVRILSLALQGKGVDKELAVNKEAIESRKHSDRIHDRKVQERYAAIGQIGLNREAPYAERSLLQREKFKLPLFPTTTIGSFPQTPEIRQTRRCFKSGNLSEAQYVDRMQAEIRDAVERQHRIGLDVLVHGEPERNDMVEYFGEQLNGYAFTEFGWVQSYGSRCVKPPIIFGDVSRENSMTVSWSKYAQSLTEKTMKGMLTGAVTMLQWSFVRDDQPREVTCNQIALALRDEVMDLEEAGIEMIQIDEAALREGLPLKKSQWQGYLDWAVNSFRLTTSGVKNTTQIHTHMCYSEFNDIIKAVAGMDADVITIETSKSHMGLLQAFVDFEYPNEIGPGVYDIHSPNVPLVDQMVQLMEKAAENIPLERLWINPDCGLKTRGWTETEAALCNMVKAAETLREQYLLKSA
ncbi:5-methyltetrahydropteroyltriglutamate--homocysteine S-methyltransferase [Thiomicrorhabdus sp. ZW0627]|uniref:5-methyltetrahydropteroyltriglutamate-- homocysteine S-methyltransferase n=1 Tax=Thiomicrorhabdus sp. ZW0627 TaxID=3039774 RepID=UPI0024367C27|nr:5-methyltetrahydropteroyltriglutamate--homocysteine S-methyltransferase [Thiomicrorhabdus sp. ZW0627]MDG6774296.1 5-methyltetrahydropteroyltriglutamate--homocysteine S-methyltransferase [Thiomicrorhabdus sp. ZW0627]